TSVSTHPENTPMKPPRRARLGLERLEARECPAITASLYAGNLTVSGFPTGLLAITETAANVFPGQEGASVIGSYSANNITVRLTFRPDDVNVQLIPVGLAGNL